MLLLLVQLLCLSFACVAILGCLRGCITTRRNARMKEANFRRRWGRGGLHAFFLSLLTIDRSKCLYSFRMRLARANRRRLEAAEDRASRRYRKAYDKVFNYYRSPEEAATTDVAN